MNWDRARRWIQAPRVQADEPLPAHAQVVNALEANGNGATRAILPPVPELVVARARSICVASGKGGTGKSVVSSSLACLLAEHTPTLLVDADLGVGNAHILLDVAPDRSLVDVVERRATAREVRVRCGVNLDLLPGGSGVSRVAALDAFELDMLGSELASLERDYGFILVDSAAGISPQTIEIAARSDLVLLVTTPDVTALTDAYAFLKVLAQVAPGCEPYFVVNRVADVEEGLAIAERLRAVARKFLRREPRCAGVLPDDRAVTRGVNARSPVCRHEPEAEFSRALRVVAATVAEEALLGASKGLGRGLLDRG